MKWIISFFVAILLTASVAHSSGVGSDNAVIPITIVSGEKNQQTAKVVERVLDFQQGFRGIQFSTSPRCLPEHYFCLSYEVARIRDSLAVAIMYRRSGHLYKCFSLTMYFGVPSEEEEVEIISLLIARLILDVMEATHEHPH